MSELNRLGFSRADYQGGKSTLCTGCGHDSITNHIISAFYQSSVNPYKVAKMSGIGCSSKTPNYFLGRSHGLNSIHGRMAPIATGAYVCNPELTYIGVSGDGDTASIGLGSFAHMIRRNVRMVYVVENNGVYGLTKGQFSATAEQGSNRKTGDENIFSHIDICSLALESGATFVARSFSGDSKQLVALLNLALRHRGTAVLDVISPCVTFGNHEGFGRSYETVRGTNKQLQDMGFIQPQTEIKIDYAEGAVQEVHLHDGSRVWLRKLEHDHDVTDKRHAFDRLREAREKREILTGLFYWNKEAKPLEDHLGMSSIPLNQLSDVDLVPSKEALQDILTDYL